MEHYLKALESTIRSHWDLPAVCDFGGESFSYGKMALDIEKFHIFFEKAGIAKGDRIALCASNSARWAISFLAVNTYEAVVVPILSNFTPDAVTNLVAHSGSLILFTDKEIWNRMNPEDLPALKAVICAGDSTLLYSSSEEVRAAFENVAEELALRYPMGFSAANVTYPDGNDKELAVINYTSGTTSSPKGVMIRYECFSATIEFGIANAPFTSGETVVSMLPMGHIYGLVFEMMYPVCHGATIYFLGKTPSPTLLLRAFREVKPFLILAVPLVMEKIYKSSIKPAFSPWYMKLLLALPGISDIIYWKAGKKLMAAFGGNVRQIIMGGAALNRSVERCFKRCRIPFTIGYGMTEASPLLAYASPASFVTGSCGRPIDSVVMRIDSEDPTRIAGEIQVKGTNICSGYYNNEEANEGAFTADGYLRTGDLGIMDKNGNVFLKGRSKTMILTSSGQNIYPEEVEGAINSQPYIAESVVVDRSSKLVALVYLDQDAITKDGLSDEDVADIPETARVAANKTLPAYSQITKMEIVLEPFAKTPKLSIKRFLYK